MGKRELRRFGCLDEMGVTYLHNWISAKIKEHQAVIRRPHPYEIELYHDL